MQLKIVCIFLKNLTCSGKHSDLVHTHFSLKYWPKGSRVPTLAPVSALACLDHMMTPQVDISDIL